MTCSGPWEINLEYHETTHIQTHIINPYFENCIFCIYKTKSLHGLSMHLCLMTYLIMFMLKITIAMLLFHVAGHGGLWEI